MFVTNMWHNPKSTSELASSALCPPTAYQSLKSRGCDITALTVQWPLCVPTASQMPAYPSGCQAMGRPMWKTLLPGSSMSPHEIDQEVAEVMWSSIYVCIMYHSSVIVRVYDAELAYLEMMLCYVIIRRSNLAIAV